MHRYTHWLVTASRSGRLTPLVLVPIQTTLPALVRLVRAEVERRALIFTPAQATSVQRLAALGSDYLAQAANGLEVQEVRLAQRDDSTPDEVATHWTLVLTGRLLPDWQGPADGVIPRDARITIRSRHAEPSRLQIIDD